MAKTFEQLLQGYQQFRQQYALGDDALMKQLAEDGQKPNTLVVACCDSRVVPALLLQCDPGDLFVIRNVANLIPPYENDKAYHGTSAALEFGVCYLNVKHLIIFGHSQCGGVHAAMHKETLKQNDFIGDWTDLIKPADDVKNVDTCAKGSIQQSYRNALTFPWIKTRVEQKTLELHQWFFDIETGLIYTCQDPTQQGDEVFKPLDIK